MSDPSSTAGDGDSKDDSIAKTAGVVVFSGIAISILKALNPFNKNRNEEAPPLSESTQPIQLPSQPPLPSQQQQPITAKEQHPTLPKSITSKDENVQETPKPSHKTIQIEKGDTLWGLSREHGKSITSKDENVQETPKPSYKTIEIEKGDTLWGLSREHGVSIDAIKEANGLTGDTIYAGKKLIIP